MLAFCILKTLNIRKMVKGLPGLWAEAVYLSRIRPLPLSEGRGYNKLVSVGVTLSD